MTLKRQLMLVSLLTLMLPWAGCEFIRQTETALRSVQQEMLAGTARAMANSLTRYAEEFPPGVPNGMSGDQLYLHELQRRPNVDGYFNDWPLTASSLRTIRGPDGPIRLAAGTYANDIYLYVEVSDHNVVYTTTQNSALDHQPRYADRVSLISNSPPYLQQEFMFAAEAPGAIVSYKRDDKQPEPQAAIRAHWQDVPGGYRVEVRLPGSLMGTHLGIIVSNTADAAEPPTRIKSYDGDGPPPTVRLSPELAAEATLLVQSGMRLLVTDAAGWRLASAGQLSSIADEDANGSGWSRRAYDLLVDPGTAAHFAEPDPRGRERQPYVSAALNGREMGSWFRGDESSRAIVAVAAPIVDDAEVIGVVILQRGTEAILSLTIQGLTRLISLTLIVIVFVAGGLLGYATWLSRRIRYLSLAAEDALENENLQASLPSALAGDEIGDLSRSFSYVLQQLGDYNAYLRSLASKLSHELRTPLAIVTSSLENLEHEPLNEASTGYTARAREGADRLRRILSAMSEANRVEALMENLDVERFDLISILEATADAYRDVYKNRDIEFSVDVVDAPAFGAPELLIQLLDKLVDNAVDFSHDGDIIRIDLSRQDDEYVLSVSNPGPPLPDNMRAQLFDSMVSVRTGDDSRHLGLGLYIARLIAAGHGGRIVAENIDGGVVFSLHLPRQDSR